MTKVEELVAVVRGLPPEAVEQLLKVARAFPTKPQNAPYTPVALGGLWKDYDITEEDLRQTRQEMWRSLGDAT